MTSEEPIWIDQIKRYALQMLGSISLLLLLAFFYELYFGRYLISQRQLSNEYHQTTTSYYLLTKDSVRNIQLRRYKHDPLIDQQIRLNRIDIQQIIDHLKKALALEKSHNEPGFKELITRIDSLKHYFDDSLSGMNHAPNNSSALSDAVLDQTLDTLDQIIRLHDGRYHDRLQILETISKYGTLILFSLFGIVFAVSVSITSRGMKTIRLILQKQQLLEQKNAYQANFDILTGLPNRALINDRLNQAIKEADRLNERLAILFLDLDDFKNVNDSLGHDYGDQLLIEVARRFTQSIRKSDTLGRLGGDEFILIARGIAEKADIIGLIENLIHQI